MSAKSDNLTILVPCMCGGTPTMSSKESPLNHELSYFYKCEKCGMEGETCWPKDSVHLIPSWNNTIKIADGRKKNLDKIKKSL